MALKSAIVVESSHGPSVNEWTLLCSYKTLFTKQAAGWIWPCGAVVVLTPGVDDIDLVGHGMDFRFCFKGERILNNKLLLM